MFQVLFITGFEHDRALVYANVSPLMGLDAVGRGPVQHRAVARVAGYLSGCALAMELVVRVARCRIWAFAPNGGLDGAWQQFTAADLLPGHGAQAFGLALAALARW